MAKLEFLVYLADMYCIYKSNAPLLFKKTSFEVKHCKIETMFISRSAQAGMLKKLIFETPRPQGQDNYC